MVLSRGPPTSGLAWKPQCPTGVALAQTQCHCVADFITLLMELALFLLENMFSGRRERKTEETLEV